MHEIMASKQQEQQTRSAAEAWIRHHFLYFVHHLRLRTLSGEEHLEYGLLYLFTSRWIDDGLLDWNRMRSKEAAFAFETTPEIKPNLACFAGSIYSCRSNRSMASSIEEPFSVSAL
jgi:hypothetical protein